MYMVRRILFARFARIIEKAHKTNPSVLCALLYGLEKFLKPSAAAEKVDVEHQFIPGGYPQLLIDAPVVLPDRAHADKRQIRDLRDLVTVDVVAENIPLRLGQQILPRHELVKELGDVGRQLSLLQPLVPRPGIEEFRQLVHLGDARGQALLRQFLLLKLLEAVGDGPDKSPRQEEGKG